jgi:hypothetical protein
MKAILTWRCLSQAMRVASTLMQYQILSTGTRVWQSEVPGIALHVGLNKLASLERCVARVHEKYGVRKK